MTEPVGPIDPLEIPRFAGRSTFARLPPLEDVGRAEVAVVGIPFDTGTSYRPGARFGPIAIRQASRLLRGYHPGLDVMPFAVQQVADAGDIGVTPFDIPEAIRQIEAGARELLGSASKIITIGGDHTISLPLLRVLREAHGPISLLHFDAHLDTWDTYFGQAYTHGTPFRRAWEEGLLLEDTSMHVGTRGPIFEPQDLVNDERFGFKILSSMDVADAGAADTVERIRARLGTGPVYVSIDVDVMDPAFTPGTGTPEAGGLTSREMLQILRGLLGVNIVGADVVEVSPPYDHAELTAIAASHLVYEFISLFAAARR
jgi:guanidinobutyrase / D-arginase